MSEFRTCLVKDGFPASYPCCHCDKKLQKDDVAIFARKRITVASGKQVPYPIAFHKECLIELLEHEFPETRYQIMRKKYAALLAAS
jgi:hypothetical protein